MKVIVNVRCDHNLPLDTPCHDCLDERQQEFESDYRIKDECEPMRQAWETWAEASHNDSASNLELLKTLEFHVRNLRQIIVKE